jgi:hypothetical protein
MTKTFEFPDGTTFTTQFDDAFFWQTDSCECQLIVRPQPSPQQEGLLHVRTFVTCAIHRVRGQALVNEIINHTRPFNANPNPGQPVDEQDLSDRKQAEQARINGIGPPEKPSPPD